MLVLCNFLKIWMVSHEIIHKAFRTHTTLYFYIQNQLENFLIFTTSIYQNYTLALIVIVRFTFDMFEELLSFVAIHTMVGLRALAYMMGHGGKLPPDA